MAQITKVSEILSGKYDGKTVSVRGWIHRIRESGKLLFVQLRDHTGVIQALIEKSAVAAQEFEGAKKALIESSIAISGTIEQDIRAPGGRELKANSVTIIGYAGVYPIGKQQSEELLLDNRHLWIRSRQQNAIMKVKATLLRGAREWLDNNEFFEVTPSVITTNACEGGTTLFPFKYFDMQAYLSQSAQMYLEACIFNLGNVYALTPSFRAEKSRTIRHLAEYSHLEAEEAWVVNNENISIQEELISAICQKIVAERSAELETLDRKPQEIKAIEPPFKRYTYDEAIVKLKKKGLDIDWGIDFGTNEERAISEGEEKPIFIINYPKQIKPFYMKENPTDSRTYLCSDMLAPDGFGELIGGSERETDADKIIERLKKESANISCYEWYIDLRRYGSIPHSGFGLGIERMLMWLCKLEHIREGMPFPRVINRAYP